MSLADIEKLDGSHGVLKANMRGNGWDYVVRTRRGNFQPLEPGDVVVDIEKM